MIIKITYWGMASCGKTTIIETLHKLTTEEEKDIVPKGDLTKIAKDSGETLYYDGGYFHSRQNNLELYNIQTVAGQKSFAPIRRSVFKKTNGVIFVVNSEIKYLEDNIEYLKELRKVSEDKLITEIPLIVMLNKKDLAETISVDDFTQILKEEKLWYEPNNKLSIWNPIIYETCALYDQRKNIYRSFHEIIRRTTLYMTLGNGKAPRKENMAD